MSTDPALKPRVGVPYRTLKEELTADRSRYDMYLEAVRRAGGDPVEVSLRLAESDLRRLTESLDAVVLPGSPSDVDPSRFGAVRHSKCAEADLKREETDFALLEHAIAEHKPVLAICYGNQSLNVFLGGSLIQDIASELHSAIQHQWVGRKQGVPEPFHAAQIEPGSRLATLAGSVGARVNSSHHQSILEPGRRLRVAARAPDGVVEAVEWTGDENWITGVQWHPERMIETDPLAQALFREVVAAGRKVRAQNLTASVRQ
ncbi:MAG TPA: gamma-glutamyl-gamma-aminobutyrate hydrolase family protein [Candidatus Acidoferrum sp.]|nr:gamma-glutamyl-gamma-aminobutyrate hydrolase family protein [Candidatus Acidoferrum sp.]